MPNYYFAVASQKFLFEEEPLEEILRERIYHYKSINKPIDFWLIKNSSFVNFADLNNITKMIQQPVAAILSYDLNFINWIKLRLGFVLIGEYSSPSIIHHYVDLNQSDNYIYDRIIL